MFYAGTIYLSFTRSPMAYLHGALFCAANGMLIAAAFWPMALWNPKPKPAPPPT